MHAFGNKNLFKQMSEQMFSFDRDQIPKWSGVGNRFHPANMLTRVVARRRFEDRSFTVEIGFVNHS